MKKILGLLLILGCVGLVKADELASSYDINGRIHYENAGVTSSTQIIVMDLSDTTNFPHQKTGYFGISKVELAFISLTSGTTISSGTFQLGVVTNVNNSTGTVKWFATYPYFTTSSATVSYNNLLAPIYTRTRVTPVINGDGTTPYIMSNTSSAGSTAYQDDVTLPTSFTTSAFPALGDVILNIAPSTGALGSIVLDIFYQGVKP